MNSQQIIPYEFRNLPIPGGGYVTGILMHPTDRKVMYIRTDIGGAYRYDFEEQRFESLIDGVTMFDLSDTYPLALALDPAHPERLYVASGIERNRFGILSVSEDYGHTFTRKKIPTMVHGNCSGRSTGARLVVDPVDSDVLWFASLRGGLLRSDDRGTTWKKLYTGGEEWMTFVFVSPDGQTVVAGTAGVKTRLSEKLRGHSLYVSYDRGETFNELSMPKNCTYPGSPMNGYVAQRYSFDSQYLYITLCVTGPTAFRIESGYSCDVGDVADGLVIRYPYKDGVLGPYELITPPHELIALGDPGEALHKTAVPGSPFTFGFGGIDTNPAVPGLVICSTICRKVGDFIFRSRDYGKTWETILSVVNPDNVVVHTSYMKPEYNGGISSIHWVSDFRIAPTNPNVAWFNTGMGTFRTRNLLDEKVRFEDWCDGIEETVHLNIYSPVNGPVKVIDLVGDLGGFAFCDTDTQCRNSFEDENKNRYAACLNADSPDISPNRVIVTARSNWTGTSKGGLLYSEDYGESYTRLPMPYGISPAIDAKLQHIEGPATNPGWAAISADGSSIVWCVSDNNSLPLNSIVNTQNLGKTWNKTLVLDASDNEITTGYMKVFADRFDSHIMYGFGSSSQIYISKDAGQTFRQQIVPDLFPKVDFSLVDVFNKTEVRGESGKPGVFYMALNINGLWKMTYNKYTSELNFKHITKPGEYVYRIGLGVLREGGDYINEPKALYISGSIDEIYGFYRSLDDGRSWQRLNRNDQMYGDINSIDGDKHEFGRFYIATGSRGALYGEEIHDFMD